LAQRQRLGSFNHFYAFGCESFQGLRLNVADKGWTRFMKEVLPFVFLCTFALEGVAIAKQRTSEQRKETIRISVNDSADPKPASYPTFNVYSGGPRSLNLHRVLLITGVSSGLQRHISDAEIFAGKSKHDWIKASQKLELAT
jgi:hypothetical protein